MHGYIEKLAELSHAGRPFVSVTLVSTVGSTPQDAGAKMLVGEAGLVFGTIGGGRVENQALAHARGMLASREQAACQWVEWNLQRDVGMTCGGVVRLLFEAYNAGGWRVVVFGAGHVAQALVRCLLLLECRIVCIDPRAEWLGKLPESSQLRTVEMAEPRAFVCELQPEDYVLCLTMGHRTDRPILQAIYERGLTTPYLGVIGSAAKRKVLERELVAAGVAPEKLTALRCPLGLPLGSNQPGEIAVSITAELIQCRDAARASG